MGEGKPYIRKKGQKYIIEKKVNGKSIYMMTLPSVEELLNTRRLGKKEPKASRNDNKNNQILLKLFAY